MPHYLYVATNSAMPGLVKIGHTTREPDARMRELQTTGVPRPFELQLVLIVADGLKAEQAAHRLFDNARESSSREFFRLSVEKAVPSLLSNVVHQSIDWSHTPSDSKSQALVTSYLIAKLSTLDAEIDETNKSVLRIERERPRAALLNKKADLQRKRSELGAKPTKPDMGGANLFSFAYYPAPFGWVFWLGSVAQFSMGNTDIAIVLAACIGVGFFTHRAQERREEDYRRSLTPWSEIENELATVQQELESRDSVVEALRALQAKKIAISDSIRSNSKQSIPSVVLPRLEKAVAPQIVAAPNPPATPVKRNANFSNAPFSLNQGSERSADSPIRVANSNRQTKALPVVSNKTGVVIYGTSNFRALPIFEVENGYAVVMEEDLYIYETKSFLQSAIHQRLMSATDMSKEGLVEILRKGTFFPKYP